MKFTEKELEVIAQVKRKLIKQQQNGDIEIAHCNADDYLCRLLIEFGLQDIVDEYNKIDKWYA